MAQPSTESVNALLTHFARVGVPGVPRFLGYDERGRQILTYVAGSANPDPSDLGPEDLARVGQLIRSLHDAADSFVEPEGARWNVLITPDESTLICHHDLAPWNLVRGAGTMTFIDWDGAGPGSRLWDLAYAAHGFVPLSPRAELTLDEAARRLRALVEGSRRCSPGCRSARTCRRSVPPIGRSLPTTPRGERRWTPRAKGRYSTPSFERARRHFRTSKVRSGRMGTCTSYASPTNSKPALVATRSEATLPMTVSRESSCRSSTSKAHCTRSTSARVVAP
ncbi:MAG: hypothetical protein B7X07_00380 [Actinobacteria bacterium 21-64-8]|nr:MAG: hypothetical protein B7X07_00380 [Actinobacteria bacterium 21-64-8]